MNLSFGELLALPLPAQIALFALVAGSLTLTVVGVVVWARTPDTVMPAPNRWMWLAVLVVQIIGPIAFLVARNAKRRETFAPTTTPTSRPATHPNDVLDDLYGQRHD